MEFGVDSHKATLAIAGIDALGREVCRAEYANTPVGHRALLAWARAQASERRFGIEGSGGYGLPLAHALVAAGERCVEVPGQLTDRQRRHLRPAGKSDATDAVAIARVCAREACLPPVDADPASRDLHELVEYHDQLQGDSTRLRNRLHHDLCRLRPGYQDRCPNLVAKRHQQTARRLLRGDTGVPAELARRRLQTLARLDADIATLERRLAGLVTATGTGLTGIVGVGPLIAARILAEVRDIDRFATRDRFARANGTAPIPASTGGSGRHRLNRGGNRKLNRAIHYVALVQVRCDPRARAYLDRKRAEGKTYRDAIRGLKRHLSDVIYNQLRRDTVPTA